MVLYAKTLSSVPKNSSSDVLSLLQQLEEVVMVKLVGFPVLGNMNSFRTNLFQKSHNNFQRYDSPYQAPMASRVGCWFLHKAVSVISLPANAVAAGVGLAGMTATGCTLGAFKVAVYALSLGNIKLTFPIGFLWLGQRTISSMCNVLSTIGELGFDALDLGYQGYRGVRYVLTALKMDHLMKYVNQALEFAGTRIMKGIDKSVSDEQALDVADLPAVLKDLQQATEKRSCFNENQDGAMFVEHKLLSIVNISLQSTVAVASGVACGVALVASAAKAALYAATNIHVGIPTGVSYMGRISLLSGINAAQNCTELVADAAISLYRVADALHVVKAIVAARDVITFIPRAICS